MTTALMVRAASATEMVKLLMADRVIHLAVEVADAQVRTDVELYATPVESDGVWFYDIGAVMEGTSIQGAATLARAVAYIRARGDALPWRVKHHTIRRNLMRFEEKHKEESPE